MPGGQRSQRSWARPGTQEAQTWDCKRCGEQLSFVRWPCSTKNCEWVGWRTMRRQQGNSYFLAEVSRKARYWGPVITLATLCFAGSAWNCKWGNGGRQVISLDGECSAAGRGDAHLHPNIVYRPGVMILQMLALDDVPQVFAARHCDTCKRCEQPCLLLPDHRPLEPLTQGGEHRCLKLSLEFHFFDQIGEDMGVVCLFLPLSSRAHDMLRPSAG